MLLLRDLVTLTNFNIFSYGWANHQTKAADTADPADSGYSSLGSRDFITTYLREFENLNGKFTLWGKSP